MKFEHKKDIDKGTHNIKHINDNISGQLTITFGSFVGINFFF